MRATKQVEEHHDVRPGVKKSDGERLTEQKAGIEKEFGMVFADESRLIVVKWAKIGKAKTIVK